MLSTFPFILRHLLCWLAFRLCCLCRVAFAVSPLPPLSPLPCRLCHLVAFVLFCWLLRSMLLPLLPFHSSCLANHCRVPSRVFESMSLPVAVESCRLAIPLLHRDLASLSTLSTHRGLAFPWVMPLNAFASLLPLLSCRRGDKSPFRCLTRKKEHNKSE